MFWNCLCGVPRWWNLSMTYLVTKSKSCYLQGTLNPQWFHLLKYGKVQVRDKRWEGYTGENIEQMKCFWFWPIFRRIKLDKYRTLAIITHSWILTIHKNIIFCKNLLENQGIDFKNGVENIQTAGYNGACTVYNYTCIEIHL